MKLTEMFPKRFATGEDFQGKALTLTVKAVSSEKMRPQRNAPEVDRWVIYFKETKKGVILSRTLAYQIAGILNSDDTDRWIGKKVTLHPQPMNVAGKQVVAIRARAGENGIKLEQEDCMPEEKVSEEEGGYSEEASTACSRPVTYNGDNGHRRHGSEGFYRIF
jgi:hypothetical protein